MKSHHFLDRTNIRAYYVVSDENLPAFEKKYRRRLNSGKMIRVPAEQVFDAETRGWHSVYRAWETGTAK